MIKQKRNKEDTIKQPQRHKVIKEKLSIIAKITSSLVPSCAEVPVLSSVEVSTVMPTSVEASPRLGNGGAIPTLLLSTCAPSWQKQVFRLPAALSVLAFILCLWLNSSYAQEYRATVNYPGTAGLYRIQLPQSVQNVIGPEDYRIRIKDASGKEAPFKIIQASHKVSSTDFVQISGIRFSKTDTSTVIIIPNETSGRSNLILKIANAQTDKTFYIEGSDNEQEWFSLLSNGTLGDLSSNSSTFTFQNISFPNTDFRFVKLVINDKKDAPLLVQAVGDWKHSQSSPALEQLQNISFSIETADKKSIIHILKNGKAVAKVLSVSISSPEFFSRDASIYTVQKDKRGKAEKTFVQALTLDKKRLNFQLDRPIPANDFYIEIDNQDNPALVIDSISLFAPARQIITQLEAGKQYHMEIDSSFNRPVYDIENIDLSKTPISTATISGLEKLHKNVPQKSKNGKLLLWTGSILGVIIVFFFGYRLIKDIQRGGS